LAAGLHPDLLGELERSPDPLAAQRGLLLRGGEARRGRKGRGRERKGMRRERGRGGRIRRRNGREGAEGKGERWGRGGG